MYSDYWASSDQLTSVHKSPWGFDREDNRKLDCPLAKTRDFLHREHWPNATGDFSFTHSNFNQKVGGLSKTQTPAHNPQHQFTPNKKSPESFAQNNYSNDRITSSTQRLIKNGSSFGRSTPQLETSGYMVSTQKESFRNNTHAMTQSSSSSQLEREHLFTPQKGMKGHLFTPQKGMKGHYPDTRSLYSITNVGLQEQRSTRVKHIQNENFQHYVKAAEDMSKRNDMVVMAETHHFRHKYPHTLGRLKCFSEMKENNL